MGVAEYCGRFSAYCGRLLCRHCRGFPRPLCYRSIEYFYVDVRISYTRCGYILNSTALPLDTTTGVQLADASDLKGVRARAVEDKSSDTSKRKAPPPDITTDVHLADASDLKVKFARAVKLNSSGTSKRKAPSPDTTTGAQLDLNVKFARAVKLKSSGTSKRKAPPPDTTSVQLVHASVPEGVYARPVKDKSSGTIVGYKYEPRLIPPREKVHDGTTRKFNRLSLGEYRTPDEAKIVLQIARFYYDKDQDYVQLDDHGQFKFFIPPMNEQERRLAGEEKRKWVTTKSKEVYADLGIQKRNFEQLSVGNGTGACSSHDSDIGVLEVPSVSSATALEVPSCLAPLPPCDVVDGLGDMIDELLCPDSKNFLPQQSSLNCEIRYLGFGQILGDSNSLQGNGVTQGIHGSIDGHLSPRVDFQQGWDLVGFGQILGDSNSPQADGGTQGNQGSIDGHLSPGKDFQQGWDLVGATGSNFFAEPSYPVLQQLVHCQKQQLVVKASQIVDLEHRLCEFEIRLRESEIRNSVLQQEIDRLTSHSRMGA